MRREELIYTIWKGIAIAFAGTVAFLANLFRKYPNFSSKGEEIVFYASVAVNLTLAISLASLTIKLWRISR